MSEDDLAEQLQRICDTIYELIDRDLFVWLDSGSQPKKEQVQRASTVVADRLCGALSNPIIRNAQERRQLASLKTWLDAREYSQVPPVEVGEAEQLKPGHYTFRLNVTVGKGKSAVNVPVDCVIQPRAAKEGSVPILIEAKSAGDPTNPNKRRKEEAQKIKQLRGKYGSDVPYVLLLCGYFEPGYLGYEASEGIDWIWEHRLNDLGQLLHGEKGPTNPSAPAIGDEAATFVTEQADREDRRASAQKKIDAFKSQEERNRLGQFATPFGLARDMVSCSLPFLESPADYSFLEPALGTGVFFSALDATHQTGSLSRAVGVELDAQYGEAARIFWDHPPYEVIVDDFVQFSARKEHRDGFDLVCTNPPYVRHHHLSTDLKKGLQARLKQETGIALSGLSGLYVYFLLLTDPLLRAGAVASWLVPSEFLYVNYGKPLRDYLLRNVTLLRLHQFDPVEVQFEDALVSSCVVIYKKHQPTGQNCFRYTYGGTLADPLEEREIANDSHLLGNKWILRKGYGQIKPNARGISIGDLFEVKRGIATGCNSFFIMDQETRDQFQIPRSLVSPILPSPRFVSELIIETKDNGDPDLSYSRYLLDCSLPPEVLKQKYPQVWKYLELGGFKGVPNAYLCSRRNPWYLQERRNPPLFLSTYMGRANSKRDHPFRFFLNMSNAIATNVYLLLYPKPSLKVSLANSRERMVELLQILNSLHSSVVIGGGRTYGGGLHKLEPKELSNLCIPRIPKWLEHKVQGELVLSV